MIAINAELRKKKGDINNQRDLTKFLQMVRNSTFTYSLTKYFVLHETEVHSI